MKISLYTTFQDLSLFSSYRRFYINSHFGGCPADEGWLIVLDGSDACSWTVKAAYPTFDYALGSQMGLWGDGKLHVSHILILHAFAFL